MRAVKAKHLRRMAREATKGAPDKQLVAQLNNRTTHIHHPEMTRAVYQKFKKLPWRFERTVTGARKLVAA